MCLWRFRRAPVILARPVNGAVRIVGGRERPVHPGDDQQDFSDEI
jgi:hypothetical protein